MNIYKEIQKLITYSILNNLMNTEDEIFIRNSILGILKLDNFEEHTIDINEIKEIKYPTAILDNITKWAAENKRLKENLLVYEDILNASIMGVIIDKPSFIREKFYAKYKINKMDATNFFYTLSKKSNYIRTDRISKNISYKYNSKYGEMDITINLSKPEKDPKEIALLKNKSQNTYPKTMLCKENEGYIGRINHPARQNHRIINLKINNEDWFFQYSPYSYYNEHSIVFSSEIKPMKINKDTFKKLTDFIELFPHYFIGSNADLPIVGGSILNHDHFQAGRYTFPIEKAKTEYIKTVNNVDISVVNWAMSVIRLNSNNKEYIVDIADKILNLWEKYDENNIVPYTNNIKHNTITPIARFNKNGLYELDLVLRNNLTNDKYPFGIFHAHEDKHNIKKENIGLIEVMGLAVLPSRLKSEISELQNILTNSKNIKDIEEKIYENESLIKHINFIKKYDNENNMHTIDLYNCVGDTFTKVLEDCNVLTLEAIKKFIKNII